MGAFEKGEDIMILGLVVAIGYGLYKFSQSFQDAINNFFGLSAGDAKTAPAGYGGTYMNAASQTMSHPLDTLENILGIGPAYPSTVGSTVVQTGPAGGASSSW